MKCTYEITIDGQRKTFSSSLELDAFLAANFSNYFVDRSNLSLHVDLQQEAKNKINEIVEKVGKAKVEITVENEDGDLVKVLAIPKSKGATKVLKTYGSPDDLSKPLVTPFNEAVYEENLRKELKNEGNTLDEIDTIISKIKGSWKVLTNLGLDIHTIPEHMIGGGSSSLNFLKQYASDKTVKRLGVHFDRFFEEIKERHGKNCIMLSEVPIVSKQINEVYTKGDDGIESINGIIDLLVIDELGVAHIYDFKVSRKHVGNWGENRNEFINNDEWGSTKKLSASYQLAIYATILRQYGIKVGDTCVVPIWLDVEYEDNNIDIKSIKNAEIEFEKIQYSPNGMSHNRKIISMLPSETLLDNIDLVQAVQEPMTKFFPNYTVELQIQANTLTVERYINDDKKVHRLRKGDHGYEKYKWKVFTGTGWRYVKTEEELKSIVQRVINDENSKRGVEFETLATALYNKADLREVVRGTRNTKDYTIRLFSKYIREGSTWEFQNNPMFVSAGMFVFVNNVTKKMEIVSLHHNESHAEVNLGKGTSLLGTIKNNFDVDEHVVFKATNGNIDLMKIMCVLNSLGEENLNKFQITKISSHNIWHRTGSELFNEDLYENFALLCRTYDVPLNIKAHHFDSTLDSTLSQIRDICGEEEYRHIGNLTFTLSPDNIVQGTDWILKKMQYLREHGTKGEVLRQYLASGKFEDFVDPFVKAYMLLGQALNKINGYNVYIEKDPGMWLEDRFATGLMINSPGNAPSLNIQTVSKIFSVAERHITKGVMSYQPRIKKVLEAFYAYHNRNSAWGGEVKYFDNLFVKDEMGNIDKSMTLRNPNDPGLAKEESDLIRVFLQIFNELRMNDSTDVHKYKDQEGGMYTEDDPEYYQVPLALASRLTMRHKKGVVAEIKDHYVNQLNFLRIFPQQEENYRNFDRTGQVYNKYAIDQNSRNTLLEKVDINEFETDLEKIFWDYVQNYERCVVMSEFLPRLQAVKISLQYMHRMFGIKIENMEEYINKFIDLNVYNKPIMDEKLQPYYKGIGVIRDIVTATSLGFNYRSGIREMVSGIWINMSRSLVNMYGPNHFNKGELIKAWTLICKDSLRNPNLLTLIDALNVDYQMANADLGQLQEQMSRSKSGIKNLESDTLFIFSRIPDVYNRMGILIAQMMHDGCWDAHYMTEDDELKYDFTKDRRFALLHDKNADKSSIEYRTQHALYTAMREQFNKEGFSLKDGEALPRAYTLQEGTSIKSFADMCFGHYDKSTQMLMKHKFFGAFVLHFKTFLSAKAEQWILKPGTYNQGRYAEKFENGQRIVRVFTFDENGIPSVRIDYENNVKEGETWEPYIEWQGRFMEGMAYSMLSFGKALYKMDAQKLKELWNNPTKRANFYLFLNDMVWLGLLAWILQLLLGENDETVLGHALVTPTIQALNDGNIYNIASSMLGDINPAFMTSSYKIINNTWDLITGEKSFGKVLTGTFGSLSSLKYAVEEATA